MKKSIIIFLLFAAFNASAQESFFRGNNNYQAPTIFTPSISGTSVVSNISRYGASSGGTITDNGGAPILASGICWSSTSSTPTILDNKTTDGTSIGNFTSSLTGLTAGVTYNVRAYATNRKGTSYGSVQTFTTTSTVVIPTVGSSLGGGKVAYVYQNGDPGYSSTNIPVLIAANADQVGNLTGGTALWSITGASGIAQKVGLIGVSYEALGAGLTNTNAIINSYGAGNYAAKYAKNYTDGVYSDWYLPSINELGKLYLNRIAIGGFSNQYYWSSTEVQETPTQISAYSWSFNGTGNNKHMDSKAWNMKLRAVRTISLSPSTTPVLTSTNPTSTISSTSATVEGNVTDEGMTQVSITGFVYGTSAGSSTYSVTTGSGAGTFSTTLTGLTAGTTYFVRSFATNAQGTGYGAETSFTTLTTATISATASATSITSSNANTGGTITSDGGAAITSRGVVYGTSTGSATFSITTGTGTGTYTISLTGLTPATTYFVRSFATNSVGTVYGIETNFVTLAVAPTLTTSAASSNTKYAASAGGTITSNGGSTITASGICWSTTATPTISDNKTTDGTTSGTFTSTITGLTAGTTYFVRAYAINSIGTSYGAAQSFTTLSTATAQTTVLIGSQRWTDKNLNVANYRNGDAITYAANATEWNAATNAGIGAWSYYNFDATNGLIFGKLYNWFAVNDSRGLAPAGYHIPTKIEYNTLSTNSGSALKAASSEWGASMGTNSTGFAGLPGGNNNITGSNRFEDKGTSGWFWTSDYDVSNPLKAYFRLLHISAGFVDVGSYAKTYGFSVRLVKDDNSIETSPTSPVIAATTSATSITANSAILGGNITDEGATQVSARGLVYGTTTGSSTFSVTIGSGAGTFTGTISGLTQGTKYFVRSFATNVQGTAYGAETSFTTQTTPTVSVTATPTSLTTTSAVGGGTISTTGGATITTSGLVWDANANPTIALATKTTDGTTSGTFTSSITGLTQGATYHVRAYATNYLGTSYGPDISFTTITTPIVSATATVTSITGTTATSGGTITSDGGATVTSRGLVWGTTTGSSTFSSTSGTGTGTYTASITGLSIATTYFVRSFATNIAGTVFGPEVQFATPSTATVASTITSTITSSTAILGGVLTSNGAATTTIGIMYSTASNFGTFSTTSINLNAFAGTYTTSITGLSAVTNYYAKAYATNTAGTTYGPTISFTTPVAPIAINDIYGGGIVYYILQPGDNGYDANVQHGLIAQQTNEPHNSGITTWNQIALNSNTISVAQNDGTLVGKANTAAIIANQGNGTYLFKYVSTLTINGYSDWYVPSIREVNLFRNYVYNTTYCISNGAFPYYWINKANSSYKWAWGSYVSSTQSGSSYYANYIENNGVHTKAYSQRQSGDNYIYLAIRSF